MALTNAERQQRYRERHQDGQPVVRYRKPSDRRSRPQRWAEAVETLLSVLDDYQLWRDNMPASLADTPTAERIEAVLEVRDLVEQLQAVELPRGFGRD
jgi:hypothetical protein